VSAQHENLLIGARVATGGWGPIEAQDQQMTSSVRRKRNELMASQAMNTTTRETYKENYRIDVATSDRRPSNDLLKKKKHPVP